MWASARRERRAKAREAFRRLMWETAARCEPGEQIQAAWLHWADHSFFYRRGADEYVSLDIGFIGMTPMVAWQAGSLVRSVPSADGRISLTRAVPADLLVACRAALDAHHARVEAEAQRIRAREALDADAETLLGFWHPRPSEPIETRLRFPFESLTVSRTDTGTLRFTVRTKTLSGLSADQVRRLKALCDEVTR